MRENAYKYIFLLLPVFFLANTALARPRSNDSCRISFSGRVIDVDNREVLIGAVIYIKQLQTGTTSNGKGIFYLDNICPGRYKIVCSYIGYDDVVVDMMDLRKPVKDYVFRMHSDAILLNETVISGKRIEENATNTKISLNEKQLQENTGKSLGEVLENLEGVTTLQTGPTISKPIINGLHSQRIVIVTNGVRQEGQQWGTEHAPEIDPAIAQEITVVKGANAVRYGPDALAGVVLLNSKPLIKITGTGFSFSPFYATNNGLYGTSAVLETKANNFYFRSHASAKQAGNTKAPAYYINNTGFTEAAFSATAGYLKERGGISASYSYFHTKIGIFTGAHIGNLTDLQRAFEQKQPVDKAGFTYEIQRPYQLVGHHITQLNGYNYIGTNNKINYQVAWQDNNRQEFDKHKPRNEELAKKPELHYNIKTLTADASFEHLFNEFLKISAGLSGMQQRNNYSGRFFIPNFLNFGAGAYSIATITRKKFEVEAGVRYDVRQLNLFMWQGRELHKPKHSFNGFSANSGISYHFSHHFTLNFNSGLAWRPPYPNEMYSSGLHHGAAAIEYGNAQLVPERAWNNVLSAHYWHSRIFNLSTTIYTNFIQDFIYLSPRLPAELTIRGAFPVFEHAQTNANLSGADLALEWLPIQSWTFRAKAMYLYAQDLEKQQPLIFMPANRFNAEAEYSFKLAGNRAFARVGAAHVMQQQRVPANVDYTNPPPAYTLLNAATGADVKAFGRLITISISANNLLNTSYRDYMNRFRYFTDEQGRNFTFRLYVPFGALNNTSEIEKF